MKILDLVFGNKMSMSDVLPWQHQNFYTIKIKCVYMSMKLMPNFMFIQEVFQEKTCFVIYPIGVPAITSQFIQFAYLKNIYISATKRAISIKDK